jgi:hypothetical protein
MLDKYRQAIVDSRYSTTVEVKAIGVVELLADVLQWRARTNLSMSMQVEPQDLLL